MDSATARVDAQPEPVPPAAAPTDLRRNGDYRDGTATSAQLSRPGGSLSEVVPAEPVTVPASGAIEETSATPMSQLADAARRQGGDRLESLLRRVHVLALRYARARLGRFGVEDAAQDVAQEVCMAVHMALPRYVDRGLPFEAFVYSVAARKVADVQRRVMREPRPVGELPEGPSGDPDPEERALLADDAARIWLATTALSDVAREIVVLRVVLGWSTHETAAALGMSVGAVRVAQHRALNRLRDVMAAQRESP